MQVSGTKCLIPWGVSLRQGKMVCSSTHVLLTVRARGRIHGTQTTHHVSVTRYACSSWQLQTRNHLCPNYTVKFLLESSVLPILMKPFPFLTTRRELLKLSGTGSSGGETQSTPTARTLAITLAIILCSGETINTNYSLPASIRMARGAYPQRV